MKQTDEELQRLLRSYLDPDDEHPDLEDVLFRYADGTTYRLSYVAVEDDDE